MAWVRRVLEQNGDVIGERIRIDALIIDDNEIWFPVAIHVSHRQGQRSLPDGIPEGIEEAARFRWIPEEDREETFSLGESFAKRISRGDIEFAVAVQVSYGHKPIQFEGGEPCICPSSTDATKPPQLTRDTVRTARKPRR